jgi:hypothetical protein
MPTVDRNATSDAVVPTPASGTARRAEAGRSPLTTRGRQFIASLIVPDAPPARTGEPSIDPAVRRWVPLVVPMLAVLVSGCILAIWSIL